jgi:membrane glycosyltransferase
MRLRTQTEIRKQFGGGLRALIGILIETVLSGLIAPVMMIFQSIAVGEIMLGRDAGWQVQRRNDGEVPRREIIRKYALPTFIGVVMAASAYAVSLPLLLWMAPVIAGLVLAIPIAMLSSTADPDLHRSALLNTPEQTAPPKVLLRANELADTPHRAVFSPLQELRNDPNLLAAHLKSLPATPRIRGRIDPHLAIARAKIEDAESIDEALGYLNSRETFAVLNSGTVLQSLLQTPVGQAAER